ncbi:DUF2911 domain-containing protein [Chitinophaga filiformis]|uniref:DUF2911 domain-containing protein n=1 Tax=Chitinophaga filiformis TaxID=104663 RepID=A0A1G7MCI0_CHIFI|nr:DUF2911 domain-containing protein [Chitinophaga filiformis]SDF59356.1 Protein of unknown function [Chitinophaga filiformis]
MKLPLIIIMCFSLRAVAQQPYTASFIAKLGTDTVIVETYNMMHDHLYGKAFLRYPEDRIGVFNFHFHPDGSIQHYSMSYMKPDSSYVTSSGTEGMICENDTCTWFAGWAGLESEYVNKRAVRHIDFIGGWTPTLSLVEWNCMRLMHSGKQNLPITLVNDYIGTRDVSLTKGNNDTLIFGGPFLEYAKIKATNEGRIMSYDGIGTPWNYIVSKHAPIDVDEAAKRMSKTHKIGIPSPQAQVHFSFGKDTIRLRYGRPFKRGRVIFGGIVPYDSIWRTGANDPTEIDLPFDIQFGQTIVPKGKYSIYSIPRKGAWTLIFNTDLQQWPTDPNRSKDLALIPMKWRIPRQQTDQFTIDIEVLNDGGVIKFTWDQTEAFAPFRIVKR